MVDDQGRHGAGTYQMLWDCKFCGTTKLLGVTHRHCPNCGAAQDPAARYFPAEDDMVAVENHQYVGADKMCPACNQPNSAASAYCSECGADLATGKVVATQGTREIGTGRAEGDAPHDLVKENFMAEMERIGATPDRAKAAFLGLRKKEWGIFGGIALVVLIIVGIVYAVTYRKDVAGKVERLSWTRTIEIEDFQPRTGGDWRDSLPADAYSLSCSERQRSTRKVETGSHQECRDVDQGDGSFKRECRTVKEYRDEPVYDTWCSYRVDRWGHARDVKAEGDSSRDPVPRWPDYTLATGSGRYGEERVGGRDEDYRVHIREDDGDSHTCTFGDQAKWEQYTVGAAVALKVGLRGGADCDTLKLAE